MIFCGNFDLICFNESIHHQIRDKIHLQFDIFYIYRAQFKEFEIGFDKGFQKVLDWGEIESKSN